MGDGARGDIEALKRMVEALHPWLSSLVLVGGWAHRLHRLLPVAQSLDYQPVVTRDADLLLVEPGAIAGDIGQALTHAGFREELSGEHRPPVTSYHLTDDRHGFHVEFLVPLFGSGMRRDGTPDATVAAAGITAQKLRYLDMLLLHPWVVHLDGVGGAQGAGGVHLRVPNPVCFLVQKLLIHAERPAAKRAQDALYVHDTLELFGARLPELRLLWRTELAPRLASTFAAKIPALISQQYGAVTDMHRAAVRIPQDRTLLPHRLQARCAVGLREIFGTE